MIIGGLFHDIGKVKTLTDNNQLTFLGSMIEHDALTLEVCAQPLSELEIHNPMYAGILRHCWTCASPNARYGFKPQYRIATYIQEADNMSSKLI